MQSFVQELRRRNVLRVAAFYAAASWLLVQVATQVFPFFDIPNWVVRLVVIASILGFPLALALSWFYELTPQGLVLESHVPREASITRLTGRRLDRWIIAALSLAVVVLLGDKPALHHDGRASLAAQGKSIAVLPFENLSDDKDNAYFASGIQDLILTKLAGIAELKVIARTSTEKYGSHPDDLRIVAQQLGVARILEGSVQKAGNQTLVNVQLIDGSTGAHLWAEAYTRTLENIFGVEGEVAQAVADAMKAKLTQGEQQAVSALPTANPAAYDLFLRAEYFYDKAFRDFTGDGLDTAIDLYQQAVSSDPAFALAWARLSTARSLAYILDRRAGVPTQQIGETALAAAEQALDLQPDLAEAHLAKGRWQAWIQRDTAAAAKSFDEALRLRPNDSGALFSKVIVLRNQGRYDEAADLMAKAVSLDPRNTVLADEQGSTLRNARRFAQAEQSYQRALALDPDNVFGAIGYAWLVVSRYGDVPRALALVPGQDMQSRRMQAKLLTLQRKYREAIAIYEGIPDSPRNFNIGTGPKALRLGLLYQAAGETEKARPLLQEVRRQLQVWFDDPQGEPDRRYLAGMHLAEAESALGERDAAVATIDAALAKISPDEPVEGVLGKQSDAAEAYAQAGRADLAVPLLQQLISQQGPGADLSAILLRLDPVWDAIRDDPRFVKLLVDAEARDRSSV